MRGLTLEQVFADFVRLRPLKERTLYDYRRLVEVAFANRKNRPLVGINKAAVIEKHQALGQASGEAYANLAMRFLRSLFNFAIAQYEDRPSRSHAYLATGRSSGLGLEVLAIY